MRRFPRVSYMMRGVAFERERRGGAKDWEVVVLFTPVHASWMLYCFPWFYLFEGVLFSVGKGWWSNGRWTQQHRGVCVCFAFRVFTVYAACCYQCDMAVTRPFPLWHVVKYVLCMMRQKEEDRVAFDLYPQSLKGFRWARERGEGREGQGFCSCCPLLPYPEGIGRSGSGGNEKSVHMFETALQTPRGWLFCLCASVCKCVVVCVSTGVWVIFFYICECMFSLLIPGTGLRCLSDSRPRVRFRRSSWRGRNAM